MNPKIICGQYAPKFGDSEKIGSEGKIYSASIWMLINGAMPTRFSV